MQTSGTIDNIVKEANFSNRGAKEMKSGSFYGGDNSELYRTYLVEISKILVRSMEFSLKQNHLTRVLLACP